MAEGGLGFMPRAGEIGDAPGQFDRSGDWSLVAISTSAATSEATHSHLKVAKDLDSLVETHHLQMTNGILFDWKLHMLLEIDDLFKMEITYRISGIAKALKIWVACHRGPQSPTSLIPICEVKYFPYCFYLDFNLFDKMIYCIISMNKLICELDQNEENVCASSFTVDEGGNKGQECCLKEIEVAPVDLESFATSSDADNLIDETQKDQNYGTLRRSITMQNIHSAYDEMETKSPFFQDVPSTSGVERKKSKFARKVNQILDALKPSRRRLSVRDLEEKGADRKKTHEAFGADCPNKFLSEFRVRSAAVLSGQRAEAAAGRCLCEVAVPLKRVRLRLHTVLEEEEEEKTAALRNLSVGSGDEGRGSGRWWARAARSVRRALLSCFGCGH